MHLSLSSTESIGLTQDNLLAALDIFLKQNVIFHVFLYQSDEEKHVATYVSPIHNLSKLQDEILALHAKLCHFLEAGNHYL